MNGDIFAAPVELKVQADETGYFEGMGAVYNNVDSHGDLIVKNAFEETLAEHKARGTMPAMFLEHGPFTGGDRLPVGVWKEVTETDDGLLCKGKISALDTDYGRRVRSLMIDGALKGLSIAFKVLPGGAVMAKSAQGARRTLKKIGLHAIDLVTSPSNELARVEHVKMMGGLIDPAGATDKIVAAMLLVEETLKGGNSPNGEARMRIRGVLMDAHESLTGSRMPIGIKMKPETIRELEAVLREQGFSNAEAREIAERGYKSAAEPRDEVESKKAESLVDDELKALLNKYPNK